MGNKKDWFSNIKEKYKLKNLKKDQFIILLLIGLLLCVIVIPTDKKKEVIKEDENVDNTRISSQIQSEKEEDYEAKVEQRLKDALSYVDGVGKVEVMITMKDSGQIVVEKDVPETSSTVSETDSNGGTRTTIEHSSSEETIYSKSEDGTSMPYVTKNLEPEIEGILIVAQGGDSSVTVQNICEAVLALFPVELHKIKVVKMIE